MATQAEFDRWFMIQAIAQAKKGAAHNQDPFGCVITFREVIIARAGGTGSHAEPLRHCEMESIEAACSALGGLLHGCTLYSTHEPCTMCCGAIKHSKISRVVFGSWRTDLPHLFRRNDYTARHILRDTKDPPELVPGVMRAECIALFERTLALP